MLLGLIKRSGVSKGTIQRTFSQTGMHSEKKKKTPRNLVY